MRRMRQIGAVLLAIGLMGIGAAHPTYAATDMVSNCNSTGNGSLAGVVSAAGSGDIVNFSNGVNCSGTSKIVLSTPISISKTLTIDGAGHTIVIDGGGTTQLFSVSSAGNVTLNNLTLQNGYAGYPGGGAVGNAGGTVTISNSTLTGNQAASGWDGGAINNGAFNTGGTVTITDSTLNGNSSGDNGGAVYNGSASTLSITGSTLDNNSPGTYYNAGGAIENDGGTATIDSSTLSGNTGTNSPNGGAISNTNGGQMTIRNNSVISNNSAYEAGAIFNYGSTLTIDDSTLSGNTANDNGGGAISNGGSGSSVTIQNGSTLSDNQATGYGAYGGAIYSDGGSITVNGSSLLNNSTTYVSQFYPSPGGAIYTQGGTVSVTGSTVSGNSATGGGGGIDNNGAAVTVATSTFSGNSATSGGAIAADSATNISSSTFSGNTLTTDGEGGTLVNGNNGTMTVTNSTIASTFSGSYGVVTNQHIMSIGGTIIADSSGGNCYAFSGITDSGYNLEWSGSGHSDTCGFSTANHDITDQDPLLDSSGLGSNGGPTQTIALEPGSPAIDAIPTSSGLCSATDQRGNARPDDSESSCDIGAYESDYTSTTVSTSLTSVSGSGTYGGTGTLTATLEDASNHPLSGQTVDFTLNGNDVGSATTGTDGVATLPGVDLTGIDAGSYSTAVGAGFSGDASYGSSTGSGVLTVAQANQTITFVLPPGFSQTYGASPFDVGSYASGGGSSSPVTFSSTTLAVCTVSGSTVTIVAAGTCTIDADQSGDTNYNAASTVEQSFDVAPAPITVTGSHTALSYGDPVPDPSTYTILYSGFVNGDQQSSIVGSDAPSCSTDYTSTAPAGVYTILCTIGTLDSTAADNYTFVNSDGVPLPADTGTPVSIGTFSVGEQGTSITAVSGSGTYGGTAQLTATFGDASNTNLAGQNVEFYLNGTDVGGATTGTDGVATRLVSLTGINAGTDTGGVVAKFVDPSGNYADSQGSGDLQVAKATLIITPTHDPITYGDPAPTDGWGYTAIGFVGSDNASNTTITGSPSACGTTYQQGDPAGGYPITCTDVIGMSSTNYTFALASAPGTLEVQPATPTFGFDLSSLPAKTYGDAPFSVAGSSYVTKTGDGQVTFSKGNGSVGCNVSADGTVTITGAATGSNQCIVDATLLPSTNYTGAGPIEQSFNIAQAPLSVTASHPDITYGDAAPGSDSYTVNYSGFVNGDTAAALLSSGALSGSPACTTPYSQGDNPGSYAINCTLGTLAATNYTFVSGFAGTAGTALDPTTAVQLGVLDVSSPVLTITANDQTVQYGDPLPALTVSYSGFVNGDGPSSLSGTLSCSTTGVNVSSSGQVLSPAGTYVGAITCSGLTSTKYTITWNPGTLTVTREDAVVRLAQNNPHAVQVTRSGTAPSMTFTARITEASDGSYGNISKAIPVTFTLASVGSGGTYTCTVPSSNGTVTKVQPATSTSPGFELVSCTLPAGTPINVYEVTATVGGNYYQGSDNDVLTVYNPTAGGSNGGFTVTNPNTGNVADVAYTATYLKNGQVQGKFLYIARDSSGNVVHILKGNVMSTMAISGNTAKITGKATLDGVGNYSYVITGIDNSTPSSSTNPDQYAQQVTASSGNQVSDLTFNPVAIVPGGNIFVGKK